MLKANEIVMPDSCLNRANDSEMIFVLLARDAAAPVAIRAWIGERLRTGKNKKDDPQIRDAEYCAGQMDLQREGEIGPVPF